MCECCLADCETLGELGPYWSLVRARRDGNRMKAGQLGLRTSNDPTFYLSATPILAPEDSLDPEIGWVHEAWDRFFDAADALEEDLKCDPSTGYSLVSSCLLAGYGPGDDPDVEEVLPIFSQWLCDHLGRMLAVEKP
jgi:hypothetical protein